MTGGRCSEVDLVLKLLGRDLERPLLTGGCYSEVVVNTGLTVKRDTLRGRGSNNGTDTENGTQFNHTEGQLYKN